MKIIIKTQNGTEEIKGSFKVVIVQLEYTDWLERFLYTAYYYKIKDTFTLKCGEKVTGEFFIYIKNYNPKEKKLYKTVKITMESRNKYTFKCIP